MNTTEADLDALDLMMAAREMAALAGHELALAGWFYESSSRILVADCRKRCCLAGVVIDWSSGCARHRDPSFVYPCRGGVT